MPFAILENLTGRVFGRLTVQSLNARAQGRVSWLCLCTCGKTKAVAARPCRDCGSEYLYAAGYKIACCSCLGDGCEDCNAEGSCANCSENANGPDAITRWNLIFGDDGPPGRVQVIGGI